MENDENVGLSLTGGSNTEAAAVGRRFNIPIELLINRMTKFPADKIGIKNRGEIKENNFADLVVFNSDEINDLATFEDPDVISDRFVESEESQFSHICVLGFVPEVLKL